MKKEILLVKFNTAAWAWYAIFMGILLIIAASSTKAFTALPDFQGSFKAIMADVLFFPVMLGAISLSIPIYRFPKRIEINELESRVAIDGHDIAFPAEVTIESNKLVTELFKVVILSQGKQKLSTGFIYKLENDSPEQDSLSKRQTKISFIAH